MNELIPAKRATDWRRLKSLVLDSVSSPITRRVYNLGLDEFFAWFGQRSRDRDSTRRRSAPGESLSRPAG
jgi:predicted DCC family thiol-disulfide oxidoreductase YuxK